MGRQIAWWGAGGWKIEGDDRVAFYFPFFSLIGNKSGIYMEKER